jgi:hypothetical protein
MACNHQYVLAFSYSRPGCPGATRPEQSSARNRPAGLHEVSSIHKKTKNQNVKCKLKEVIAATRQFHYFGD